MIRCILSKGSRKASLLRAGNRYYSTTKPSEEKPPTSKALPSLSSPFGDNASHTSLEDDLALDELDKVLESSFGLAKNVPVEPTYEYPGDHVEAPDLPMSPFMDPEYAAAKQKGREPKLPPSKNPTHFQKQLAKNPYAIALSTPVRLCPLSRTTLPNFFLQDFGLMAHPETREPWWVPGNLTSKYRTTERESDGETEPSDKGKEVVDPSSELPETQSETQEVLDQQASPGGTGSHTTEDSGNQADTLDTPQKSAESTKPVINNNHNPETLGMNVWIASRQELLAALQIPSTGFGSEPWKRISASTMTGKNTAKLLERSNWRKDMDTFILELMRRRLREAIEDLYGLKRGYINGCKDWQKAALPKRQTAVILWAGPSIQKGEVIEEGGEQVHGPPEFATYDIEPLSITATGVRRRTKIPVYNLRMLLGKDHLHQLRARIPHFKQELLIIREKRRALDVLLKLWKLQGYLARYEEFFSMDDARETMDSLKMQRLPKDLFNAERSRENEKSDAFVGRRNKKPGLGRGKEEMGERLLDRGQGREKRRDRGESENLDLDDRPSRGRLYERQL